MKVIKKTFLTAAILVFFIALCLLAVVLSLAACSEKVTLRFETFGGTYLESVEGKVGTAYTVPEEPQKEGYYFEGWYLNSDFSGEPQSLPSSMPDESRTYYAKYGRYPVLTILPEGGEVEKTTHLIKPGVNLNSYLEEFEPKKEGLVFGGWYEGDKLVEDSVVMSDKDLTLSARYKAKYEINVFLQNADEPEKFDLSESLSTSGFEWEGEKVYPTFTPPEHFHEDATQKGEEFRVLSAGENILNYYYLRQEVTFTYFVAGGGEEQTFSEKTRYGAKVQFPFSPLKREGAEFFGWAREKNAPALHLPGDEILAGEGDETFYGTWGKKFYNVRGEGALVVEDNEKDSTQAYFCTASTLSRGTFQKGENTFEAEGLFGRLDGRGGCLLDDSGSYLKAALRGMGEEPQRLTLDFKTNTAVLLAGSKEIKGDYIYEFDGDKNAYTGKYLFQSGEVSFRFAIDEGNATFLKQGAEMGEYQKFDGRSFENHATLTLDGFGRAEGVIDGKEFSGTYRGSGESEKEWIFEGEETFRFLTICRTFGAGEKSLSEKGFVVFDEALCGNFEGSGSLTLDGYGILGEYVSLSGDRFTGTFAREGDFITLYAEKELKFTLRGSAFYRTSEEAGNYAGARGDLALDGAGFGKLTLSSGAIIEGSYRKLPEGEIEFSLPTGESMRLRLSKEGYEIYDPSLYGTFEGSYTARLFLDGYGSGIYTSIDSAENFPIQVRHFDGELLVIEGENLKKPLNFRIGADRELYLLQGPAVGKYFIEGETDGYLFLYDERCAKLVLGDKTMQGRYSYDAKQKVASLLFDEGSEKFLLEEGEGTPFCVRYTGETIYEGKGRLTLNGFGEGTYENGEKVTGKYRLVEGGVELTAGERSYLFTVEGDIIKERVVYLRYVCENYVLLLEEGGNRAVFESESGRLCGCYEVNRFIVDGNEKFSFRTAGDNFAFYDPALEKSFLLSDGGTLTLDGCGGGKLTYGDVLAEGKASFKGELLIFTSDALQTLKRTRVFKISENVLEPLGEEYGTYFCAGEELFLDGAGGAILSGRVGSYEALSEKYEYALKFEGVRIRIKIFLEGEEGRFLKYNEALSKQAGVYETTIGKLYVVGGYEVYLQDGDGNKTKWEVISATGNAFVAKSQGGTTYLFTGGNLVATYESLEIL